MEIIFSDSLKKDFRKIKDKAVRLRVINHLKKLGDLPESGRPLQYDLKNHRTVRVPPFRIIYRLEEGEIIVLCFDHRKDVYE